MKKFLIVDGNNIAFRAFYALPSLKTITGELTSVLYGFTNILVKILNEVKPDYIAVAFDKGKKTFRHKMYSEYKVTRTPTPDDLVVQMPKLKELLKAMKIPVLEDVEIEADDIIGILSKSFDTKNIILSADKDVYQLINKNTYIMAPRNGVSQTAIIDENALYEMYALTPSQIVDFKALMGDSSDNIPGVKGVGEKTALSLLASYNSLDGVYENIYNLKGKLQENLIADKEKAYLSKELATIVVDTNKNYKLEDFVCEFPFDDSVKTLFLKYQFTALLKRTDLFKSPTALEPKQVLNIINVEGVNQVKELVDICKNQAELPICIDENAMHVCVNDSEHIISFEGDLLTIKNDLQATINLFKDIFESKTVKKIVYDAKKMQHILYRYNIVLKNIGFDVLLARYLIYSGARGVATVDEVFIENGLSDKVKAHNLLTLKKDYSNLLKEFDLEKLYYEMELPLTNVLFNMEREGFKIDKKELIVLKEKYKAELEQLTNDIHDLAGEKFNINSPKQLSEILFLKLGLHAYNNKKLSTNVTVLNELKNKHEIIPLILQYRQISKLNSTYVSAFEDLMDESTHKIHTVFNQSLTATGRLSSSEPNLQNIPVRTEEGRNIRKLFISSFENGKIITADYNQIELRLLADMSNDLSMITAYNNGEDIHKRTASEIFGVALDDVTPELRDNAKAINFGIIYGISDYGLSQSIGGTRKDASEFIRMYFKKYPNVEQYMKANVEFCKKNGYAKTYFNRRRNIPEITSTNKNLQNFGERAAMNMPLQGTASDIIKLAMIKVFDAIKNLNLKSRLILQVHDELVIDTHPEEVEKIIQILKTEMENVVRLKVSLVTSISVGDTWFEA